jgi:hypothetical protein
VSWGGGRRREEASRGRRGRRGWWCCEVCGGEGEGGVIDVGEYAGG